MENENLREGCAMQNEGKEREKRERGRSEKGGRGGEGREKGISNQGAGQICSIQSACFQLQLALRSIFPFTNSIHLTDNGKLS